MKVHSGAKRAVMMTVLAGVLTLAGVAAPAMAAQAGGHKATGGTWTEARFNCMDLNKDGKLEVSEFTRHTSCAKPAHKAKVHQDKAKAKAKAMVPAAN